MHGSRTVAKLPEERKAGAENIWRQQLISREYGFEADL
jgi:hypothetical protein